MLSRKAVVDKVLAYLNGDLALAGLVHWAEDTMVLLVESDRDLPDEASLIHILGYIAAGDTSDFPLTWEVLTAFLQELDTKVRIVVQAA